LKDTVKHRLARVEAWLERIGPAWATAVLCAGAALAAYAVHIVMVLSEGRLPAATALMNLTVECCAVAAPLILYSRRVIGRLARSRAELQHMSEQLRLAAEAAEESSRAKSAFLANMSHELRTPLNAILGFSEIMKDQHLGPVSNPRYLAYSADIHSSGRHLLGIINDVLDLAKIESGKMSLDGAGEFALRPALDAALGMLNGLGEKHGVALRCEWDAGDARLVAVERMVHQIVINLVGNAIKFTPAGGKVILRGAALAEGGYLLTVRDTGIGMSESEIANALIPFGQNRTKMAVRHEGTGLGLPLAKAMMELHGGALTVDSQLDHGTCISLYFPAACVAPARRQAAA
jgi:signal transduction histidine kinase